MRLFQSQNTIDPFKNVEFAEHAACKHSCAELLLKEIENVENEIAYLKTLKNPVVLDLGANVGLYSLFYRDWAQWVVAVEPSPSNRKVLDSLVAQFGRGKIDVLPFAVSDKNGPVEFYEGTLNSTSNSLIQHEQHNKTVTVNQRSLDEIVFVHAKMGGNGRIDFIKMDIEGSEEAAVNSLTQDVADMIGCLYIEVHPNSGADSKRIALKLGSLGFQICTLTKHRVFARR